MEKFEQYKPVSLLELSEMELDGLSPNEFAELIELVVSESKEVISAISKEIVEMDETYFSLDAFYEIQEIFDEYEELIRILKIEDHAVLNLIIETRNVLASKNPISEIAATSSNYVLVHASNVSSLRNLILTKNETAEICATASSLRKKNDIFQPRTKSIEAGLIYNPKQAIAWFSKDVGSYTGRGKRILEERFKEFAVSSLDEALEKQIGPRIEAWVDGAKVKPSALLIIDEKAKEEVRELGRKFNLPVIYNSHFFEQQ